MLKTLVSFELIAVFFITPVLIAFGWLPAPFMTLFLLGAIIPASFWMKKQNHHSRFWRGTDVTTEKTYALKLLVRFAFITAITIVTVYFYLPDRFFYLPSTHTSTWLIFIGLYCLFSVYPQELLFRKYFSERYAILFRHSLHLKFANAATFGFVHIVFQNGVAIVLAALAGWLFASTYEKTKSLRLVCLEHSLYGVLIFSVGMDGYFIHHSNPFFMETKY